MTDQSLDHVHDASQTISAEGSIACEGSTASAQLSGCVNLHSAMDTSFSSACTRPASSHDRYGPLQHTAGGDFDGFVRSTSSRYSRLSDEQQTIVLESLIGQSRSRQRWHVLQRLPALLLRDFVSLLPTEVVRHLLSYVDGTSLLRCCRVCRAWNRVISALTPLWRDKCRHLSVRQSSTAGRLQRTDWKRLFVATSSTLWRLKNRHSFETVTLKTPSDTGGRLIALHYNDGYIAAANEFARLFVWRLSDSQCVLDFCALNPLSCLKFSVAGGRIVCGHYNGQLSSYGVPEIQLPGPESLEERAVGVVDRLRHQFWVHSGPVFSLDFSQQSDVLVSGSADNSVKVFQLSSGALLNTLDRHSHWVVCVVLRIQSGGVGGKELSTGSRQHLLLTMTRDEVRVFVVSESADSPSSVFESFQQLRAPQMVVSLAPPLCAQAEVEVPFFTPGCHLQDNVMTFIRQSPPTTGRPTSAAIVQFDLTSRTQTVRTVVSFKVKKLLAIGSRYAILLAPYAEESCPNLYLVDLSSGDVIGSEQVPHSRLSTPDAAQLTVGPTRWLDGLDEAALLRGSAGDLVAAMGTETSREIFLLRWKRQEEIGSAADEMTSDDCGGAVSDVDSDV